MVNRIRVSLFLVIAILVASCGRNRPAVFSFQPAPGDGWEQTDTLSFSIDTIREGGTYQISIALRTNTATPYPFRTLSLLLTERLSSVPERSKTLSLKLDQEPAALESNGISLQQYIFIADTLHLPSAPVSGKIQVSHQMQSRQLNGIRDVGIRLEKLHDD